MTKMRRFVSTVVLLTMIMQGIAVSGWSQRAHAAFSGGGSGTIEDPYIILTANDLSDIRNNLSAHYKLGADIDLSGYDHNGDGKGWLPIGYYNANDAFGFTGSLDGNGYTINNLTINRPDIWLAGLFGKTDGSARLSNLRLQDFQIVASSVSGGLVGTMRSGTIENSYISGSVRVSDSYAGGFTGSASSSSTIDNSFSVAFVIGNDLIGGLIGSNSGLIKNSYAAGRIYGNDEVGGLVGRSYGNIVNSYAAGDVNGYSDIGGLIGRDIDGSATSSYWNIDTSGRTSSALGTGISSEEMKQAGTFGWDSSVWGIIEGVTYPYLRTFGMGIGVDPLANKTYNLQPGQDAVSVTGSVYHESAMEPIEIRYILYNNTTSTIAADVTYPTDNSVALRSINRRIPLSGYANGDYTITVLATDGHNTLVGTSLAFNVNASAASPPSVQYTNNDESWTNSVSTTVTVDDNDLDDASLYYAWSSDTVTPGPGSTWTPFANGDTLTRSGVSGDFYLHIRAKDNTGNTSNVVSNRFRLDNSAPTVTFTPIGNEDWAKTASTQVTVTDAGSGVNTSSLKYAWSGSTSTPASGWNTFTSGSSLSISTGNGNQYLHIEASDAVGNTANVVSNRFRLDNTAPSINISMTKEDSSVYANDTWTNQSVTLNQTATDANGVVTNEYTVDGGTSWNPYTAPIVLEDDGIHLLSFRAVDAAGNETTVHRTVKISSSGLMLTPTLTTLGGDPYVSGAWTNESVTISVYAQAGDSGIASITYTLDGGSPQAYVNEDPITVSQEGQHTLRFDVVDGAGNTFDATLAVNIDLTGQSVDIAANGSESLSLTASTTVTVTDGASGVDVTSLEYAWTTDTTTPSSGWSAFANGDTLSQSGVSGDAYLHIRAKDLAGNTVNVVSNRFRLYVAPSYTYVPTVTKPTVDINGVALDPDSIDLTKPSVILDVTPKDGTASVGIPASLLLDFAAKNESFFFEIKTPYGSYQLPVNLGAFIPGLQELLAANKLKAEDISFKITLTDKSDDKVIQQAFADNLPNGSVMGAIVDFHLEVVDTKTGRSIGTVDQFNKALTRVIPMPKDQASMPEQWGAYRYNETKKEFEFVPARAVQIEGVWYVLIHSYSNSVYAVARNPISFKDTLSHWGKPYVELAAAKGLLEGVGGDKFAPDRSITRAEFTAMLIRALGYSGSDGSSPSYDDVKPGSWYYDIVATARQLGLLDFAAGSSFKPDQALTREEMASMLVAVISREQASLTKQQANLDHYKDAGNINAAYLDNVRIVVKLNLMTGTSSHTFSPEGSSTRAQAATVLVRTLRALEIID